MSRRKRKTKNPGYVSPEKAAKAAKAAGTPKETVGVTWDYGRNCLVCDNSPVLVQTGMCGPCTFGEADTATGDMP